MRPREIHIIGAGPAGLVAAIQLAKTGCQPIVHEQYGDAGGRFHDDFQGIENWSSKEEVRVFLRRIGIDINFLFKPFQSGYFLGPNLKPIEINTNRPLFYLIKRGRSKGSFDQGLKEQALTAGVKIIWNDKIKRINGGKLIVATGPRAADIIAKEIVFRTSHPDAYFGFLDDRIVPKGYAYLLVYRRKATFGVCMFRDFRNARTQYQRALKRMKQTVGIDIRSPAQFGGYGNFFPRSSRYHNGSVLCVGEAAGFQDALWGFGLRYALLSGYLAADSIITGQDYETLCRNYIWPSLKTSLANRWLYAHLGNWGYQKILNHLGRSGNAIDILQKYHRFSRSKFFLYRLAKLRYRTPMINKPGL